MDVKQTATVIDTTKRKRAGKTPKGIAEDFNAIVSMNADAMLILDREGYVLYANPAADSLFNLPSSELVGAYFGFPIILDGPVELHILREFKDFVAAEMRMIEIKCAGEPSYVLSFRDLTDRIMAEQALSKARDELDERVRERTRDLEAANDHLCNEIIERKRAEDALRVSEERYRAVFEKSGVGMTHVSKDGRFMRVNQKYCSITGYSSEELAAMSVADVTYPPDVAEETLLIKRLIAGEIAAFSREKRYVKKDGAIVWVNLTVTPINKNGTIDYLAGVSEDITERREAEDALRESEEKFRVLAESSSAMFWLYQGERFVYVNDAGERLTGYSVDELLRMRFWDVVHPDDRDIVRDRGLARQRGEPVPQKYEIKLLTRGGETRFVELTAGRIMYRGAPAGVATFFDITERKRAEEALRKSEANLERAQRIAAMGNWEWDLKTNMLTGSKEYYRLFGIEKMEPVPFERFASIVHPDDRGWVYAASRDVGRKDTPGSSEFRLVLPGNRIKYIHAYVEVVKDEQGRPAKVFGTMQDITERKQIEEALCEAKQQAELYLDLMGHDINNMHQIALGYLELARGMPPGVQQDTMMEKPIEVLQRCAQLIKNVRKLQKLHEGVFQTELVDVCKVLVDVQRESGSVPGKTVTLNLNGHAHCQVLANDLLHDLFSNLVGNAIKHTGERAEIVVDLDVVKVDGRRYCRSMVEDDGPGIPDDFKGKIFNRLLKGSEKTKGMGLGLYLVKSLVDSYGGRVWAEDRVLGDYTKGARFVVMLPVADRPDCEES